MTTSSHDASLSPAYILHTRKYRETSLLAELLTERDGRIAAVIRGARGGARKSGTVQPFTPILVSYTGRGELKTVTRMDVGVVNQLVGENILIGLYVNELLVRLLGKFEPLGTLFSAYQELILVLVSGVFNASALRKFELTLLTELGYGITFDIAYATTDRIEPDRYYRYVPQEGFHLLTTDIPGGAYKGEYLLAIATGDLDRKEAAACAKKIVRASFAVLLGQKPLKSRELFLL